MKNILLLLLFISSSILAQGVIISARPPQLTIESKDLGAFELGTTATDSLLAIVNTRRLEIDSATTYGGVSATIYDSTLTYGDSLWFYITFSIDSVGNFTDYIYGYNTGLLTDTATVTYSVYSTVPSLTAPQNLAITDSSDGLYLDWDNDDDVNGFNIYRSTDDATYSLLTTVAASYYDDTDIIEALRYYYYVEGFTTDSTSSPSDTVNGLSLVTTGNYAAVIYIDSSATDSTTQDGSYDDPYSSLADVSWESLDEDYDSTNIRIFFKGGYQYVGGINMPDVDATESQPIIISSYGSTERYVLRQSSYTATTNIIRLTDLTNGSSYITFENAEINGYRWVSARKTSHITFDNIYCHFYTEADPYLASGTPFDVKYSDMNIYMTIKNSIFVGGVSASNVLDNLLDFQRSHSVLIENSYFKDVNHVLLGTDRANYITIRNNRFYNTYHGALNIQTDNTTPVTDYLVENNYFERNGFGDMYLTVNPQGTIANVYLNGQDIIFRNNLLTKTGGYGSYLNPALELRASSQGGTVSGVRVYNNNIYDNYSVGLRIYLQSTATGLTDNEIFNNAFIDNGEDELSGADSTSIVLTNYTLPVVSPTDNNITYNYFSSLDNSTYDQYRSAFYDANEYNSTDYSFSNNVDGAFSTVPFDDPTDSTVITYWDATGSQNFLDSLQINFNPTTALQNKGRHLATVTSTSGTNLTVSDGKVFFDGFSWLDGDSIVVTYSDGSKEYDRISSISGNVLTLNTGVTTGGSYVDVVNEQLGGYRNSGVDIGMFEYNENDTLAPSNLSFGEVYVSSDTARFLLNFRTNFATTSLSFQLAETNDTDELADNAVTPIPSPILGTSGISVTSHKNGSLDLGKTYYYRWVLTNSEGTTTGAIQTYVHNEPSEVTGNVVAYPSTDMDDHSYGGGGSYTTNRVGNYSGSSFATGIRFTDITIPFEATIDSAYIEVTANSSLSNTDCNTRTYGELRVSPDSVVTFEYSSVHMGSRDDSVTTAYTDTTLAAWTSETSYKIYVTSIVQELVDSSAYVSQPMAFFIKDNSSTSGAYRTFYNFENGSKYARIKVWFTE